MTLLVSIIKKEGSTIDIDKLEEQIRPPQNDMFGTESMRSSVWGHRAFKTLGCDMIHSLKNDNVFAFDEELHKLKSEFETILENLDAVAEQTGCRADGIEFRVRNALEALRIALENIDDVGVALW